MKKSLKATRRVSSRVNPSKVGSVYTHISNTHSADEACGILTKARLSSDESCMILTSLIKGYLSSEVSLPVLVGVLTSFAPLKESVRTHFLQEGGQLIEELLMWEDKSTASLKALCLFFSSYHLRSYNVKEQTISSLLALARSFEHNEQKARLALNCIADYLMKIPEGVPLVLAEILELLHELSHPDRMLSGLGLKLNYSLLRSLYYCLLHSYTTFTPRQALSVFLALKRLTKLRHSSEEYLSKARGFAFQALQALFKSHSRLLFPFVGAFIDYDCKEKEKESLKVSTMARDLSLLKTLTVFVESTPFNYFHLNAEDQQSCLLSLARRTVDFAFRLAIEALRTVNDEEILFAALKLATALLKVPLHLATFARACEAIDLVRAKSRGSSVNLRKQSFATLSSACLQYASFIVKSLSIKTLSQLLADDELLPIKLGFLRDLSKKTEIPPEVRSSALVYLYKYMTHQDYKVKNGVFEAISLLCEDPAVLRRVENQLQVYIEIEDYEGIIPCLNMLSSVSVEVSDPQKTAEALLTILQHTQTPLLVGSVMKFLGFVFGQLSGDFKSKVIGKVGALAEEPVLMGDLTIAMLSIAQNTGQSLIQTDGLNEQAIAETQGLNSFGRSSWDLADELIEIAGILMKAPKMSSKGNMMGVFSNILEHSKLSFEHREVIYSHSRSLLESSSSNTVLLASKVIEQLMEYEDFAQYKWSLMGKLLRLLACTENYKSKISFVQVIQRLEFENAGNLEDLLRELYLLLECERRKVIVDPYLQTNQKAYKKELFIALSNCFLKSPLSLVKGFLTEHMHGLVKTIFQWSRENSGLINSLCSTLLEWIDNCADIPISFDCYQNLMNMAEGSLDEVSITSEELDFELIIR